MKFYFTIFLTIAPSSAPTNLIASNITSKTVYLSWDTVPDENQNGIIRYYRVNATEAETSTKLTYIAYSNELMVHDLHPYYSYQVSVAAYTVDTGPYSTTISYQMNEDGMQNFISIQL